MLESFTEMRSTAETIESVNSGGHHALANSFKMNADYMGYGSGLEFGPNPWDFNIQADVEFTEQVLNLEKTL